MSQKKKTPAEESDEFTSEPDFSASEAENKVTQRNPGDR
jgi:hypothetical protein